MQLWVDGSFCIASGDLLRSVTQEKGTGQGRLTRFLSFGLLMWTVYLIYP